MPDQPLAVMPAVGGRSSASTSMRYGDWRWQSSATSTSQRRSHEGWFRSSRWRISWFSPQKVFQLLVELLPAQAQHGWSSQGHHLRQPTASSCWQSCSTY